MKKLMKEILVHLLPIPIILILIFAWHDPLRIIFEYDNFRKEGSFIPINDDFVATQNYIHKSKKISFNSFIIGNSTNVGYKTKHFKLLLPSGSIPYQFWVSAESLFGVERRLYFLDQKKINIENVVLSLDYLLLNQKTNDDVDNISRFKHPELSNRSWLSILVHSLDFIFSYEFLSELKRVILGKEKVYQLSLGGQLIDCPFLLKNFDPITNDYFPPLCSGYKKEKQIFRDTTVSFFPKTITTKHIELLKNIRKIFERHKTIYKIPINPYFNGKYLAKEDLEIIKEIFGKENVFNFSAHPIYSKNHLYYQDDNHMNEILGSILLKEMYN